jgi:nitrogen fixation protein FixH
MKRGAAWPVAIVAALGVFVGVNVWLARVANSDPSFAVADDYYRKAIHWDDELAQRRENDRLGWRVTPALSARSDASGSVLDVSLSDHSGIPMTGARVTVTAVHNSAAGHPVGVTLADQGGGRYRATLPLAHRGMWELQVDVRRGDEHFTADLRVDESFDRE